mmetsp:Transcript_103945/g.298738  ORF Transcript_103945/g.298738 Transcript_103945/m.298738 type:complete len:326 (+) Transcript_103945:122-1099(+)
MSGCEKRMPRDRAGEQRLGNLTRGRVDLVVVGKHAGDFAKGTSDRCRCHVLDGVRRQERQLQSSGRDGGYRPNDRAAEQCLDLVAVPSCDPRGRCRELLTAVDESGLQHCKGPWEGLDSSLCALLALHVAGEGSTGTRLCNQRCRRNENESCHLRLCRSRGRDLCSSTIEALVIVRTNGTNGGDHSLSALQRPRQVCGQDIALHPIHRLCPSSSARGRTTTPADTGDRGTAGHQALADTAANEAGASEHDELLICSIGSRGRAEGQSRGRCEQHLPPSSHCSFCSSRCRHARDKRLDKADNGGGCCGQGEEASKEPPFPTPASGP